MILALDQSISSTGYVVFDDNNYPQDWGVISTEARTGAKKGNLKSMDDKIRRTREILHQLTELYNRWCFTKIVCEDYQGYSQNSKAADGLATARTIVASFSYLNRIELFTIPAKDAKRALTGKMTASKTEMCQAALKKYEWFTMYESKRSKDGFNGEAEHVADAIGMYLAGKIQMFY